MTLAGKYRWITIGAAVGLAGAVLMVTAIRLVPVYIEKRVIPGWISDAGLAPGAIHIRRVDFNGADAGPIRLDMGEASFLEIAAIQINYSLRSLLRGRIEAVVLSGLNLDLALNAQGNAIVGWEHPGEHQSRSRRESLDIPDLQNLLPIDLGRVVLRNATIAVRWRDRSFRTALDAELDTGNLRHGHLRGSVQMNVRGNRLDIVAALDALANRIDIQLEGRDLTLDRFSDLLPTDTEASGRLDLTALARGTLQPLALASLTSTGRLQRTHIVHAGVQLTNATADDGTEHPLVVQLAAGQAGQWHWSAAPFQSTQPLKVRVERLEGQVVLDNAGWRTTAAAQTSVLPQMRAMQGRPSVRIDRPLVLDWLLSADSADGCSVRYEAQAETTGRTTDDRVNMRMAQAAIQSQAPYFKLAGHYNEGRAQARFQAGTGAVELLHPQGSARSSGLSIEGELHAGSDLRIDMVLNLPDTHADFSSTTVRLPHTRLDARIARGSSREWRLTGNLNLTGGRVHHQAHDLGVDGLDVRLPLQWPAASDGPEGTVNAAAVVWKSRNIGDIKGKTALKTDGLHMDIDHASQLLPGLNVLVQTDIGVSETTVSVSVPSYAPAAAVDLSRIFPAAAGMIVNGRIQAHARIALRDGSLAGEARMDLEKGAVHQPQRQLAVEGIALKLHIQDLSTLRSGPAQRLSIARMTMGKITAGDLEIDLQIEPDYTLFIEKATLAWCLGTVQAAAVRLKPDLSNIAVTLHCDRLNLAMLLEQLGAARGSGEGSVNGTIPLHWQKGLLSFEKGFLYSTPGQTGSIQLHDTGFLLAGLPPGSPQHIQLDIATEALKDYSYTWAKLTLESQRERLLLSLDLDGKPNRLLPFAYQPQTGRFERIAGEGQAEFKGIGFTLNFNTPLNEILNYKDFMKP
jgi:hypothetical protein